MQTIELTNTIGNVDIFTLQRSLMYVEKISPATVFVKVADGLTPDQPTMQSILDNLSSQPKQMISVKPAELFNELSETDFSKLVNNVVYQNLIASYPNADIDFKITIANIPRFKAFGNCL